MALERCAVCGWAWAKHGLGGLCTPCHKKRYKYDNENDKHAFDDYGGFGSDRPFFPEKFGIIRDTFPIMDKGRK